MVKFTANIKEKKSIRKEILAKLRSQSSFANKQKSMEIKQKLLEDRIFQSASAIMFYVSKSYEVNTYEIITEALKTGKKIIVPVTSMKKNEITPSEIKNLETELEQGPFNIQQPKEEFIRPVPPENIDLVVVPGVAFDSEGNRIGHGAGYYDNFLKSLPETVFTTGLAFDFQVLKAIPTLPWDVPVKKVISA